MIDTETKEHFSQLQNSYLKFVDSLIGVLVLFWSTTLIWIVFTQENINIIIMLWIYFFIGILVMYLFFIRKELIKLQRTLDISLELQYTKWGLHPYAEIEDILSDVNIGFSNLSRLKKSFQIFPNFDFFGIIPRTIQSYIEIIHNLSNSLKYYTSEQQKTLEQAKSEVEKNITWTTELNQVSELQRVRLDRQIEQFEELQRILVKV